MVAYRGDKFGLALLNVIGESPVGVRSVRLIAEVDSVLIVVIEKMVPIDKANKLVELLEESEKDNEDSEQR